MGLVTKRDLEDMPRTDLLPSVDRSRPQSGWTVEGRPRGKPEIGIDPDETSRTSSGINLHVTPQSHVSI